jgi:hypothetical protein
MQECWQCGYVIKAEPEEGDERDDIELVCPRCLTTHIYSEDADGNLVVAEALRSDGSVIHVH